jgi:hypothetical protein
MINEIRIDTEKEQATFTIDAIGSFDKKRYVAGFVVKAFLNPIDRLSADKFRRELLGPNPESAGEEEKTMAFALSQLKYRIIEAAPFWFKGSDIGGAALKNDNIIYHVFNLATKAEEEYGKLLAKEAEEMEKALTEQLDNQTIKGFEKDPDEEVDEELSQLGPNVPEAVKKAIKAKKAK